MEEKSASELSLTMSGWRLKQEGLKNQRNCRQLENRLLILELQRQGKIKSIQKKLQSHRKLMQIRMDRFKLKQSIEMHEKDIEDEAGSNSRIFKQIRVNRASNIRSRSNQCRQSNSRLFKEIKKQREENEKMIRQESERELRLKTEKRNKVRLIEIQCKENVNKFWKLKMQEFQGMKEQQINHKLAAQQKKMESLLQLEKSEADLLSQIKKAEEMESQLLSMMAEEKSMVSTTLVNKL